jgi:hypothetical protein
MPRPVIPVTPETALIVQRASIGKLAPAVLAGSYEAFRLQFGRPTATRVAGRDDPLAGAVGYSSVPASQAAATGPVAR